MSALYDGNSYWVMLRFPVFVFVIKTGASRNLASDFDPKKISKIQNSKTSCNYEIKDKFFYQ